MQKKSLLAAIIMAFIAISLCPKIAWANTPSPNNKPVKLIIFNDQSPTPYQPLAFSNLHNTDTVVIEVINVNTFRKTYAITAVTRDVHTATLPSNGSVFPNTATSVVHAEASVDNGFPALPADESTVFGRLLAKDATITGTYQKVYADQAVVTGLLLAPWLEKYSNLGNDIASDVFEKTDIATRCLAYDQLDQFVQDANKNDTLLAVKFKVDPGLTEAGGQLDQNATDDGGVVESDSYQYAGNDVSQSTCANVESWIGNLSQPANDTKQALDTAYAKLKADGDLLQNYANIYNDSLPTKDATIVDFASLVSSAITNGVGNQVIAADTNYSSIATELASAGQLGAQYFNLNQNPARYTKALTGVPYDELEVSVQTSLGVVPTSSGQNSASSAISTSTAPAPSTTTSAQNYVLSDIPVYGRLVTDFSTGLAVTSLTNANYGTSSTTVGTTTTYTAVKTSTDQFDMNTAIYAHIYHTCPSNIAPAFTIGITPNPVRYLLGGSLIIGSSVRLILSGGAAAGSVRVPSGYKVGDTLPSSTANTDTPERLGYFGGVSIVINL